MFQHLAHSEFFGETSPQQASDDMEKDLWKLFNKFEKLIKLILVANVYELVILY